jgi:hypothetical protein
LNSLFVSFKTLSSFSRPNDRLVHLLRPLILSPFLVRIPPRLLNSSSGGGALAPRSGQVRLDHLELSLHLIALGLG